MAALRAEITGAGDLALGPGRYVTRVNYFCRPATTILAGGQG
jgi:hypothetical protein